MIKDHHCDFLHTCGPQTPRLLEASSCECTVRTILVAEQVAALPTYHTAPTYNAPYHIPLTTHPITPHLGRTCHLKRAWEEAVLALLIPLGDPVLRAQREKLPPRPRKSVNGGTRRERKQARRFASGHVSLVSASHMPHAPSLRPTPENLHPKPCTWRDARLKARARA